ncbi:MAG: D-alanine--D-alanine ligase, partial [Coriobacteriales bacterium]|nr:D-alanine--D-alanine ligase [Coriobacteriales bacterium]
MKVAVLMGGKSHEREFSLISGKNVCDALESAGHTVLPLDTVPELTQTLLQEKPDVAYNALHGTLGEDGTIQALCDLLNIPLLGCSTNVCRLTWNKSTLKATLNRYYSSIGKDMFAHPIPGICLSEACFKDMGAANALDLFKHAIGCDFPYAVKPAHCGSALGISKANNIEELAKALLLAYSFDKECIIEKWIDGVQLAVAVIGSGEDAYALPPLEIVARGEFYDTQARIQDDLADFYSPARLSSLSKDEAQAN